MAARALQTTNQIQLLKEFDMKYILSLMTLTLSLMSVSPSYALNSGTKKPHVTTYHIYADVNMRSLIKYNDGKNMQMKYVYPQLTSDTKDELIDKFNSQVLETLTNVTDDFKQRIKDHSTDSLPKELANTNNTLQVDYASSSVESGDSNYIISVRFSVSGMIVGMAHPYHYHKVINYNLDTGDNIELSQLFKPDADYLAVLSHYTRGELNKRLSDQAMIEEGTSAKAENFNIWNFKATGLLFTFEEYQVAPYVEETQTVVVPYDVLKSIIAENSVISGCIQHHKRCVNSNVLTGGFIDEAALTTNKSYASSTPSTEAPRTFGETAQKLLGYPLSLIHRT